MAGTEGKQAVNQPQAPAEPRSVLPSVLFLLFATGWAANHFAALLPVFASSEGLSHQALDGAFGIYAVGLLPALLFGGSLSDRLGRRPLLLAGAAVAGLGNLSLLCWHDQAGIFIGRLIVGAGVGVAMSAGTAWSADIGGGSGSVLAGVSLSAGFGCGPLVSGLLAQFADSATYVPFIVTIALSATAVVVGVFVARVPVDGANQYQPIHTDKERAEHGGNAIVALSSALPMALWVFSCATVTIVTMAERMQYRFSGPWVPGVAAAVTLTAGVGIQMVARRRGWRRSAGIVGAAVAALGFGAVVAAGENSVAGGLSSDRRRARHRIRLVLTRGPHRHRDDVPAQAAGHVDGRVLRRDISGFRAARAPGGDQAGSGGSYPDARARRVGRDCGIGAGRAGLRPTTIADSPPPARRLTSALACRGRRVSRV